MESKKPILYMTPASPAARAVQLTAHAIGLSLEEKLIDVSGKREHLSSEYLNMNPQHTIPTLDDNGFYLWDSHAITPYLVDKYAADDSLYPHDLQIRATVNQRLHFNSSVLSPIFFEIMYPNLLYGKEVSEEVAREINNVLSFLNIFLGQTKYVAGNQMTIADFHILVTLTTSEVFHKIDKKHTNIMTWLKTMKLLPYYEINRRGLKLNKAMAIATGIPTIHSSIHFMTPMKTK